MTRRIAISLPDELHAAIERLRKQRRLGRSALIQEVVGRYIRDNDEKALEEAYFESYRRFPESDDPDFVAWERASLEDLAKRKDHDEWPELRTTARSGGRGRTKSDPSSSPPAATRSAGARRSRAHR